MNLRKVLDKDLLELEYRIIKKNESVVHLSEKIQMLRNDDGSILKRSGMILDVTNYKEEIVNLKTKAEQLEIINSAKDNFISILSHDLTCTVYKYSWFFRNYPERNFTP